MSNSGSRFPNNHHVNVPDTYVTSKGLYDETFYPVLKASQNVSWSEKSDLAFWRGSSTGEPSLAANETPEQAMVK